MSIAAQAEVAALTAQLMQAQHELQNVYYAIGHDLRAPLRILSGFTQALREQSGAGLDATAQHYLQRIEHAGQQLTTMVDGLLNLSRLNQAELHPTMIDASQLMAEIQNDLAARYPAHTPQVEIGADIQVYGDLVLLRSALHALLDNAWKFTQGRSNAHIRVSATQTPGWLTVCVQDNGIGMDMNYANRLFVPFQHLQARADLQGVGLGLTCVQRIITRHGGSVQAQATLTEFSRFYVTLPYPDTAPHEA